MRCRTRLPASFHSNPTTYTEGAMEHAQLISNTLLVLPIYSLTSYAHLAPLIEYATHDTRSRLLILLVSPLFHPQTGVHPSTHWSDLQRLLSFIYSKASMVALQHDRVLLRIDVLVHGGNDAPISGVINNGIESVQWDACYVAYECTCIPSWARHMSTAPDNSCYCP